MTTEAKCQHHFDLPPAAGPVALGVCRKCQATAPFQNAPKLRYWRTQIKGRPAQQQDNADALRRAREES